jgi:hypothetical protein
MTTKLKKLRFERDTLRREHKACLQAGVRASALDRTPPSVGSSKRGLHSSGQKPSASIFETSRDPAPATHGSVTTGEHAGEVSLEQVTPPVYTSPNMHPPGKQDESSTPRSRDAEIALAAGLLLAGPKSDSSQAHRGAELGARSELLSQEGKQAPASTSGEKRPHPDRLVVETGADRTAKKGKALLGEVRQGGGGSLGEAEDARGGEVFSPGYKRRKQVTGEDVNRHSVNRLPAVASGAGVIQPFSTMETLHVVRGEEGELTVERRDEAAAISREEMWVAARDSVRRQTRSAPQGEAGVGPDDEPLPGRTGVGQALVTIKGDAVDLGITSAGDLMDHKSSASAEGAVKKQGSQLVSTLNRQRRALLDGAKIAGGGDRMEVAEELTTSVSADARALTTSVAADPRVLTTSVSADPRVLGARDQNERSVVGEETGAGRGGGSSRVADSWGTVGRELSGASDVRLSKQAVSEGAVRDVVPDSDTEGGEVVSPKRQRRAKSAGTVRPCNLEAWEELLRSNGGAGLQRTRNLARSFEQKIGIGGVRRSPKVGGSLEGDEDFELRGSMEKRESGAVLVGRSDGLPKGEKGRWMTARDGRAEQGRKRDSSRGLVQTRISQPTRKDAPFFKAPTLAVNEGGGRKWREASRGGDDDFLSTPMEKALIGRNGQGGQEKLRGGGVFPNGQERVTAQPADRIAVDGSAQFLQGGRTSMARDLGIGERRGNVKNRREERVTGLEDDSLGSEEVSDGEKENSQPEPDGDNMDELSQVRPNGVGLAAAAQAEAVLGEMREGPGKGGEPPRNRGIQVIKSGTYEQTAADRGRQVGAGEAPAHKYNSVVRKQAEREKLHAFECVGCKKFYDAVLVKDGDAMAQNVNNACQHHLDNAGRHRYQWAPPATPSGYWNIGFDTETQAAS